MTNNKSDTLELTMKRRIEEEWLDVVPSEINHKTLRQICAEYSDQKCVAKIYLAGKPCYLCGTASIKRSMLAKGRAMTFSEAVELFGKAAASVLEKTVRQISD